MSHTITCQIAEEYDHGSDHLLIETTIAMQMEEPHSLPQYNYSKTNWKEIDNKLKLYLLNPATFNGKATTEAAIDNFAEQLVQAITKAIQETTPHKQPSPHSKRWWTKELSSLRKEAN